MVRHRRRLITAIKGSLRELSNQLSLLNHHVGTRVDLKDVDLDCLELVNRHGPMSPSDLARSAGLHPATMTGILDRLERAGWVSASATRPTAGLCWSRCGATAAASCFACTRA